MYRLALAVGHWSVEEPGGLADTVTAWQLMRWAEYGQVEPWGETRADLRSAIVASTMANTVRGKNQRPFRPADFMPNFEPRPAQSAAHIKAVFAAYAQAVKATETKRGH